MYCISGTIFSKLFPYKRDTVTPSILPDSISIQFIPFKFWFTTPPLYTEWYHTSKPKIKNKITLNLIFDLLGYGMLASVD